MKEAGIIGGGDSDCVAGPEVVVTFPEGELAGAVKTEFADTEVTDVSVEVEGTDVFKEPVGPEAVVLRLVTAPSRARTKGKRVAHSCKASHVRMVARG